MTYQGLLILEGIHFDERIFDKKKKGEHFSNARSRIQFFSIE